jgi:hypothetical protein
MGWGEHFDINVAKKERTKTRSTKTTWERDEKCATEIL